MQTNKFIKLGMAAMMAVTLAACSSTGSDESDQDTTDTTSTTTPTGNGGSASTTGTGTTPQLTAEQIREQQMLEMTVFYFDFDRSELKPEAREALVYHANRLRANPGMNVRLEGHADERGTREYNLALGERRAQAVERYLQVQGVAGSQLETISYGEEMPVDNGTSEAAYARNRRVEMVY
ncbi:MAG: peptidoglycan-associated lipoprotein Pal [Pseudohongiellaceae bacterium]